MASFQFSAISGTTISFNASLDTLVFSTTDLAGNLVFQDIPGGGLLISLRGTTQSVTLAGLSFSAMRSINFTFPNGGIATFDSSNSDLRPGSGVSDFLPLNAGGNDTVTGGAGDDWFFANSAFNAADRVDGGSGIDTLQIRGLGATIALSSTSLTGVERVQIDSGSWNLTLAANTASSATPAPGSLFTIDASAIGSATLRVDGSAEAAAGMALIGAAGNDTLIGGGGADSLYSFAGDDSLSGGAGNDTLQSGMGGDTFRGGAGDDLFDLSSAPLGSPANATDLILDFQGAGVPGGDRIALPSGQQFVAPLRFDLDPVGFSFTGFGNTTPQLPAFMIGDGFADVVWTATNDPNYKFLLWVDANDNGIIDPTDMLIRIGTFAGDTATRLTPDDFLVEFAGFIGTAGPDRLVAGLNQDAVIYGMAGNDTIVAGRGVNVLVGSEGDDSILGGPQYDELYGGDGNDTLDGGGGQGVIFAAEPGTPEQDAGSRNLLIGSSDDDQLYSGYGADTLIGGDGNDLLWADAGADSLSAGAGDDTLFAGTDGDTLLGGAGADFFSVDLSLGLALSTAATTARIVDFSTLEGDVLGLGADQGLLNGPNGFGAIGFVGSLASRDAASPLPLATLFPGSGVSDNPYTLWWVPATSGGVAAGGWLVGDLDRDGRFSSPDLMLRITGTIGDPAQIFGTALLRPATGTSGADSLTAYALGGHLMGDAGHDTLLGSGSVDWLEGGADNDSLMGGAGGDTLDGGLGADTMQGGAGADVLVVDDTRDVTLADPGNGGADTILASASHYMGANLFELILGAGAGDLFGVGNNQDNLMLGNEGTNLLIANGGNDSVDGGEGRDLVFGLDGNDSLQGGAGIDYLVGGNGDDIIDGGNGPDEMYGQVGNNTLLGGSDFATDILVGGSGNDSIDGGPAWDLMYGNQGDDTYRVSQQVDWIFEFPGEGNDLVIADSPNGYYLYDNIENLILLGTTPFGVGNASNNSMIGSNSGNWLLGGGGNDTLDAMGGDDVLFGQAGADVFVIRANGGRDIIGDFVAGTDKLRLIGTPVQSYGQAMAGFAQVGADCVLSLGTGHQVIFQGLQFATLNASDFVFS